MLIWLKIKIDINSIATHFIVLPEADVFIAIRKNI